jgi:hypothetical protein
MSLAILQFRTALADARARSDRERRIVVCYLPIGGAVDHARVAETSQRRTQRAIQAIVRPDEPVLYCGLFPG